MTHTCILTSTSMPNDTFVDSLKNMNTSIVHEPALSVHYKFDDTPMPFVPKALIITSKHSLHKISAYNLAENIPVLCVGETTRRACLDHGFTNVLMVFDTGNDLIVYIQENASTLSHIIFPRGKDVQIDLKTVCTALNIKLYDPIVYETSFISEWGQDTLSLLKDNDSNILCVFSSRGAQSLAKFIDQHALHDYTTRTNLLCLSDRMLKYLDHFQWKNRLVSEMPTQLSFLDKIKLITQTEL